MALEGTRVLLVLPPFTQLNTPFPSTAYLKGFLNLYKVDSDQIDLGLEVVLQLFSRRGLSELFNAANLENATENSRRIFALRSVYENTIDEVILFLQHKNHSLAHAICDNDYLPRASRFEQLEDLEYAFGTMGKTDQARHLATLYLDDLSDFIADTIDPFFGFSRYAESLGRCANHFDQLQDALNEPARLPMEVMLDLLDERMAHFKPDLVALSVPFPGNLLGAFKCAQYIRYHHPSVKVVLGGGFANTELRSVSDARVFDYVDYICLDDGEAPILNLLEYMQGNRALSDLKRTFVREKGKVVFQNNSLTPDFSQAQVGTPDYRGLPLDRYLSVIELANPMHSLWSNGRWNKLTLAHGCYWAKCTFCDISLDYIKRYEQTAAPLICDRIEELIAQTGEIGFHFVDEAAPPGLLRDVALEILRRNLTVVWWTNIRFEKSFTPDLCCLLKASGCIAMSGGLEVASDRLLKLIDKGVSVEQVARVCRNFTDAGILVHAYLMYGYPTQTEEETVDSLEMVRQLFELNLIQSGFWHRFAMTAHSPVGMNPKKYDTVLVEQGVPTFANNDLEYHELNPVFHEKYSAGLKASLYNYMRGLGFDLELQAWFDEKIPKTRVKKDFILDAIQTEEPRPFRDSSRLIYVGIIPSLHVFQRTKKNQVTDWVRLTFITKQGEVAVNLEKELGIWLHSYYSQFIPGAHAVKTLKEFKSDFERNLSQDFEDFWNSESGTQLRLAGLWLI